MTFWTRFWILPAAALALGLSVNALHPRGVRWDVPVSHEKLHSFHGRVPDDKLSNDFEPDENGFPRAITLEDALTWSRRHPLLVLDARSEHDFKSAHIPGAISLPVARVEELALSFSSRAKTDEWVVTYCDSDACPLASDLAYALLQAGFEHVRVLSGGFEGWREAGEPLIVTGGER